MKLRGFTVAEAIVSCALIATVMVVSSVLFRIGVQSSRNGQLQADAQRQAVRLAAILTRDFQWSRLSQVSCQYLGGDPAAKDLLLAVCTTQKLDGQISLDPFMQRPLWQGFRLVWRENQELKELYRPFPKASPDPAVYTMSDFAADRLSQGVRTLSRGCQAFWLADQVGGPPSLTPQNRLYLNFSLVQSRTNQLLSYGFEVNLDEQ